MVKSRNPSAQDLLIGSIDVSAQRRLAVLLLLAAVCVAPVESGTNYTALIIRRLDPPAYFLVDKFKINDKDELYRIAG